MTSPDDFELEATGLVRAYVITKGRGLPDDEQLSLITLVTAAPGDEKRPLRLSPEEQRLLDICSAGYLTVAELAGHTGLPLGVVRIILAGLTEGGHVITRPPVPRARQADREILQEVLNGLQLKFG